MEFIAAGVVLFILVVLLELESVLALIIPVAVCLMLQKKEVPYYWAFGLCGYIFTLATMFMYKLVFLQTACKKYLENHNTKDLSIFSIFMLLYDDFFGLEPEEEDEDDDESSEDS